MHATCHHRTEKRSTAYCLPRRRHAFHSNILAIIGFSLTQLSVVFLSVFIIEILIWLFLRAIEDRWLFNSKTPIWQFALCSKKLKTVAPESSIHFQKKKVSKMMSKTLSSFSTFCSETSMHGWCYLSRDIHHLWKVIWATFLLFILGVFILWQCYRKLISLALIVWQNKLV